MEPTDRCENRRPRVDLLISSWAQGPGGRLGCAGGPGSPQIEASAQPRRRARTTLTRGEVDAVRTARVHGMGVAALAK